MCRIRIGYYRYTRGNSFDSQKITEGQEEGRVAGCKIKKEADDSSSVRVFYFLKKNEKKR